MLPNHPADRVAGDATLLLGDAIARLAGVPTGSVAAVICDPPYGTTACSWDSVIPMAPLWAELMRVLKPRGCAVFTACQPFTTALINGNPKWFRYSMVWDKCMATGFLNANRMPLRAHEDVLVFAKGLTTYHPQFEPGKPYRATIKPRTCETLGPKKALAVGYEIVNEGRRYPRTILRFANPNAKGKVHPTQKPVDLFRYLVRTYTDPGELVLDFACGSGTTLVAALAEGRRCLGIERDPRYHAIAAGRIRRPDSAEAAGAA